MEKIYLNELSLEGQFEDLDDFFDKSICFMKCLKYITDQKQQISKSADIFDRKITRDKTLHDLRGVRGDKARKLKSLLLKTTDTPPFWNAESEVEQEEDASYTLDKECVSGTSIAEAAEAHGVLLSFPECRYSDKELNVWKNGEEELKTYSISSCNYLAICLWKNQKIEIYDFLRMRYDGTRLEFSEFQEAYGFEIFEKNEIEECIETFDRFISLSDWKAVLNDSSLHYKRYSPSSKQKNWFRNTMYKDVMIDKFRCGNPKRCFGYRKDGKFYALRMERDHKISDNG